MSFLDDIGAWFTGGDGGDAGSSLGDAANSYYDSGGDSVAGSIGSGASDIASGLASTNNLGDSLGTSPSIDSLLSRLGIGNGGAGETASSAYDAGGDGIPGSIGTRIPATVEAVGTTGTPQVGATIAHQGLNSALTANNSKSLLQRLMGALGGGNVTPIEAAALQQALGLAGSLLYHKGPASASQLQASLASPFNKFTPGQQASFNAWAYAPPKVYVPPVYGHKQGGSVGGLSCLNYADGGAVPGAMPGPQTMPMNPGGPQTMGMNPGAMQGPQTMPMQDGPQGVPPMNPMQAFAQSHPNFDLSNPHPNFAQNHPNWMANNFPSAGIGAGGGINPGAGATPGGQFGQQGFGGGGLGVLGPARNMGFGGNGGGSQIGFGGGINPGAGPGGTGMPLNPGGGMPGIGSGPQIGGGPPPMAAYAGGGMVDPMQGGDLSQGGPFTGFVQGTDPGQSDLVPIRVSPGEYVFDADSVAALGDGNNAAGAALLDRMREKLRQVKRAAPPSDIPPPLALLAQQRGQQGPQGVS